MFQASEMPISLRLSNGRDCCVEFEARTQDSLSAGLKSAWAKYRANLADNPTFFKAQQELNGLHHQFNRDMDGTNKPGKIAEWCARGHSPEQAELLWQQLLNNRRMQMANAKRRIGSNLLPDRLQLHMGSILKPITRWWNVTGAVGGVLVYKNMQIEAFTHSGPQVWTMEQLWAAVMKGHEHEKAICLLAEDIGEEACKSFLPEKPILTLVSSSEV